MSVGSPKLDQCNCFALRKAARQISRYYDATLQPTGLRVTQFLILATLDELGEVAINDLAERLDVERTAMGKMLATLERDGHVRAQPSATDRRSKIASLTPAGKSLLREAVPLWSDAQRRFARENDATLFDRLRLGFNTPGQ